jgi:ATP-binding cassette subfamily B protein
VVTQETELFALTVEENIAYGLGKDEYTMEDVVNAAKKAFAHEFISEMKDGYQTRIGERGNRLSGGQRQRLAIARVFLRRPRLILLDEATSALDENSQEAVQQALSTLIAESNATVVLVRKSLLLKQRLLEASPSNVRFFLIPLGGSSAFHCEECGQYRGH